MPELLLGIVLVGAFGLGAVLWRSTGDARSPVAVLRSRLAKGAVVTEADLRPAEVALGEGVRAVAWARRGELVGKTAVADLPADTVLVTALVSDQPALGAGEALVGLKLGPGAYPAGELRAGDAVAVVGAAPAATAGADAASTTPTTLAANATVWAISDLADQDGDGARHPAARRGRCRSCLSRGRPGARRAGGALAMALVAFGANRSSPGVTTATLALGAVWSRGQAQPLVVEADPDGGVLVARYGLNAHPNLTELAGRSRVGLRPSDAWDHAQQLPGGLAVVVAHPSAEQTHAALRTAAPRIAQHLARLEGTDVLLDAGHLGPTSPSVAMLDGAALTLVVLRPRLDEITALSLRLPALREHGPLAAVLVGDKPYGAAEVASTLGIEVIGVLADDVEGASSLSGGTGGARRWRRSALLRSAQKVGEALAGRLTAQDAGTGVDGVAPVEDA